jgi:hypothetical protein
VTIPINGYERNIKVLLGDVKKECEPLFAKLTAMFDRLKQNSPFAWEKTEKLTLMGGGTLIPFLKEWLRDNIDRPLDDTSLHPIKGKC